MCFFQNEFYRKTVLSQIWSFHWNFLLKIHNMYVDSKIIFFEGHPQRIIGFSKKKKLYRNYRWFSKVRFWKLLDRSYSVFLKKWILSKNIFTWNIEFLLKFLFQKNKTLSLQGGGWNWVGIFCLKNLSIGILKIVFFFVTKKLDPQLHGDKMKFFSK